MARFHIVSMHYVGTKPKAEAPGEYNYQQDREQFDKTLLSLLRYYDDVRDRYKSPHEPEFRACWIVFQVQNNTSDLEDLVQSWPSDLVQHPKIHHALDIYAAACEIIDGKGPFVGKFRARLPTAQQNWGRFWKLVGSKQVSYLLSCVAELQFNTIRRIVLHTIVSACQPNRKTTDWTLKDLRHMLAFDTVYETREFLQHYQIPVVDKDDPEETFLDLASMVGRPMHPSSDMPPQYFSRSLVERKRYDRSYTAIIKGLTVKQAREQGMIDEVDKTMPLEEESLFVSGVSDDEKSTTEASNNYQLHPGASTFAPVAPMFSTPSTSFSAFGQPSAQGSITSSGISAFGQPSSQPLTGSNTFGQSSLGAITNPQPATTFTQKPLTSSNPNGGFSFASPVPTSVNGGAKTAAPTITFPSNFSSQSSTEKRSFDFGKTSTANPFVETNGSPSKQPSVLDLGNNTLHRSQPTSDSKSSAFGTPFSGFGFSSSQGASKENEPPKIPQVHITTPFGSGLASTSQSSSGASMTNGNLSSSRPVLSAPDTSKLSKDTPPISFTGFQTVPSKRVPDSTPNQPTFSWTNSTKQPTQPSTSRAAPSGVIGGTSAASPFSNSGIPAKLSEPVQKLPAPAFPSLAPANRGSGAFTGKGKVPPPPPTLPEPSTTKARESAAWDYVARQLLLHPTLGFLKQYMEHTAAPMIEQAMKNHEKEKDEEKADGFRWHVLARRYFFWWKWKVAEMRDRRVGRERRERLAAEKKAKAHRAKERERQKRVEELQKQEAKPVDQELDTFRRNLELGRHTSRPQLNLGSDLIGPTQSTQASGSGSHLPSGIDSVNSLESHMSGEGRTSVRSHKRSRTQHNVSTMLPPNNTHHRVSKLPRQSSPTPSNTSTRSNRSSLLGASILSGASVLETRGLPHGTKLSTIKTQYFTHKALGLQLEPSKPKSYSVQVGMKRARASDEFSASTGSIAENSPGRKKRFYPQESVSFSSPIRNGVSDLDTNPVPPSPLDASASSQAHNLLPEDEALFARVRAVAEAMGQSMTELKEELAKEDFRQSQNGSSHGSNSPNVHFNGSGDSRPRFGQQTSPLNNNLPKFYSRPSRFVLLENYGKRREKVPDPPKDSGKGKNSVVTSKGLTNGRMSLPYQHTSRPSPPSVPKKSASDVIDLDSD